MACHTQPWVGTRYGAGCGASGAVCPLVCCLHAAAQASCRPGPLQLLYTHREGCRICWRIPQLSRLSCSLGFTYVVFWQRLTAQGHALACIFAVLHPWHQYSPASGPMLTHCGPGGSRVNPPLISGSCCSVGCCCCTGHVRCGRGCRAHLGAFNNRPGGYQGDRQGVHGCAVVWGVVLLLRNLMCVHQPIMVCTAKQGVAAVPAKLSPRSSYRGWTHSLRHHPSKVLDTAHLPDCYSYSRCSRGQPWLLYAWPLL
jgi:hypothetical protein